MAHMIRLTSFSPSQLLPLSVTENSLSIATVVNKINLSLLKLETKKCRHMIVTHKTTGSELDASQNQIRQMGKQMQRRLKG